MEPFRCRDLRSGVRSPVLAYRSEEIGRQIRRLERVREATHQPLDVPVRGARLHHLGRVQPPPVTRGWCPQSPACNDEVTSSDDSSYQSWPAAELRPLLDHRSLEDGCGSYGIRMKPPRAHCPARRSPARPRTRSSRLGAPWRWHSSDLAGKPGYRHRSSIRKGVLSAGAIRSWSG